MRGRRHWFVRLPPWLWRGRRWLTRPLPEVKALTTLPKTADAKGQLAALRAKVPTVTSTRRPGMRRRRSSLGSSGSGRGAQNAERLARLAKLRGAEDQVSEADMKRTEALYANSVKEWRKRKRWANDMVDSIMEGYPKKRKVLLEEIGVEDDEAAKLDIKEFV